MKTGKKTICLSLWLLFAIIFNTAIPLRAQQQEQPPEPTAETQLPENKIAATANLKPSEQFDELRKITRGAEFSGLMQSIFGADAAAAIKAIDEDAPTLFEAAGENLNEKSSETLTEETERRKEKLKADLITRANQNKIKSNVKSPAKPKKPAANPRKTVSRTIAPPQFDWRQLAFGFQPLPQQRFQPFPQSQQQNGKPEIKTTLTDKEIKAEGEDKKIFDTDKASVKRTRKVESKFIKDGTVFGVEVKHTEIIDAVSKTDGKKFRKENIMFWRAEVAACPDASGITAGKGKGYVNMKYFITAADGTSTTTLRDVTVNTKTTGYVNDEAEMTHYDLTADALEIVRGYDLAVERGLMTDVNFKDGANRILYEITNNKIEIDNRADGGSLTPAKLGKIVVKVNTGSNPADNKRTDKGAGALVAGVWNYTNDMYKAARSFWRNYGCVAIESKAPKNRLKKGEQITIDAETVHKQDASKVNARLEAGALDASVSPDTQQGAPTAKFTYVHGDQKVSHFTVESFSKRGIGIGGLEFQTEGECAGGLTGKIEITKRKTENRTEVTAKGQHISDQYYSGTNEYKWSYDYSATFDVSGSTRDVNEDGSISMSLSGAISAQAARVTDEKDNWTTTTDCFPDPPRTAGQNSSSLIREIGKLSGAEGDGMMNINGARFRLTFLIPEIQATRTHHTVVKPFGWCMMDQNPPSDTTHESELSFSSEGVEIEDTVDPKNPNLIAGSKTFTDELGNEVTIRWSLRKCK
jgi:hypothetical protein